MNALATNSPSSDVADLRRQLITNGYNPVPVLTGNKMPKISGWAKLEPDLSKVDALLAAHPDHLSTGLICGTLVAIDVDVLDEAASAEIDGLIEALPGSENTLARQGMAPKTLFLFRADVARDKAVTPAYLINGKKAQVEIMGRGQQVVAFGVHPDTGHAYQWLSATPLDRPLGDIAHITSETIDQFLLDAEAVLARHGQPIKKPAPARATSRGDTFWQRVNTAALGNISAWVRSLFETAKEESGTGAWRVTSKALGRALEEDISIHPDGIHDFGEGTPETPISLVQKWGGAPNAKEAAHWLCERLGVDPANFGWESSGTVEPVTYVAANDNAPGVSSATAKKPNWPGLISSGEMVSRFTPPDYAIDGIVQSGFIYGVTASTGTGKTAVLLLLTALKAQGLPLGARDLPAGRVVYFAGENPDDVTMRWIGAAHHMGFDVDTIDVHFVPGVFDITKMFDAVAEAVNKVGGASLVIIDTSAAYFTGDDENGNVAMGKHARNLRKLTTLPGSPAVLVACHPTKNADQSNLLPRGGGAFIAELDGNLTCQKTESGTVKLHWQGKFRGPDFKPINFDLTTVTAPSLVDSKGREIPTVMASLVTDGEARARREVARKDEDLVLVALENKQPASASDLAEHLEWRDKDGEHHKRRAQTALNKLRLAKLAELTRAGWMLTKTGGPAAGHARTAVNRDRIMTESAARLVANAKPKIDRTENERTGGYGSPD